MDLSFHFFGCVYLGAESPGHTGTLVFNSAKNFQTVFQSGSTASHAHQQDSGFCTSSRTLVILLLLLSLLPSLWCEIHIVVFTCDFLMTNDEQLFMCLRAICISYLEKYLFKSFAFFKVVSFVFFIVEL